MDGELNGMTWRGVVRQAIAGLGWAGLGVEWSGVEWHGVAGHCWEWLSIKDRGQESKLGGEMIIDNVLYVDLIIKLLNKKC